MPDIQSIMAQLLYLMTRYTHYPDQQLSAAITEHLTVLSCHPDCTAKPLKASAHRLASNWRQEMRLKELDADSPLVDGVVDGERTTQACYKVH